MMLKHGASIPPVDNCLEAFCAKEHHKALEENCTMLMTPGWIRAWPRIMEAYGWDVVDVRISLGRYDRILVLETGINPLSEEEILELYPVTGTAISA